MDTEYRFRRPPKGDTKDDVALSDDSQEDLQQVTQQLDGLASELRNAMKELREKEDSGPKAAARPDTLVHEVKAAVAYLTEQKEDRDAQQEERDRKKKRRRKWGWVATLLGAIGAPGGGYAYYRMPDKVDAEDIQVQINERVDPLEKAVLGCTPSEVRDKTCTDKMRKESVKGVGETNSKKTERLGDLHMSQRELIIDVRDEDTKLQRDIAKRLRVELPEGEPETVTEARKEVKAYKKRKAAKEAQEALKLGDPFADL